MRHPGVSAAHHVDRKSLRKITGRTADFHELAQDCVCFANGAGGELLVGLEDGEAHPPPAQRVDRALLDQIRKRVAELTVNVEVLPEIRLDGVKIGKHVWDDQVLSPIELIDTVWTEVPDFRESYELPAGMFRTTVPAFDQEVVRELLVNALVHRRYTQRGDIFLNLHPDRLEIVNPGRLPRSRARRAAGVRRLGATS